MRCASINARSRSRLRRRRGYLALGSLGMLIGDLDRFFVRMALFQLAYNRARFSCRADAALAAEAAAQPR
jgi:hypothetical protein